MTECIYVYVYMRKAYSQLFLSSVFLFGRTDRNGVASEKLMKWLVEQETEACSNPTYNQSSDQAHRLTQWHKAKHSVFYKTLNPTSTGGWGYAGLMGTKS